MKRAVAVGAAVTVGVAVWWYFAREADEDEYVENSKETVRSKSERSSHSIKPASKTAKEALRRDYVTGLLNLTSEASNNGGAVTIKLGERDIVVLSDPIDCRRVLKESTAHALGAIRPATNTFIGANALFCLEGEAWKLHRSVFVNALTINDDVLWGVESSAVKLARRLGDVCKKHQPMNIEMNSMLSLFHMACTFKALTGKDLGCLDGKYDLNELVFISKSEKVSDFRNAFEFLLEELPKRAQSADASIREDYESMNARNAPWHLHSEKVKALVMQAAQKAVSNDQLFANKISRASSGDLKKTASKIAEAVFAGYNTSVVAMGFMLFYLAQNPAAYPRVLREVDSAFSKSAPGSRLKLTAERFPFLLKVFKETTRLVPPQPMTARHLEREVSLPGCGLTLPPQTHVWVPIVALGQDSNSWGADASLFKPDRFSKDREGYLPFSHGPRSCPGEEFAQTECVVGCAILLRFFTFDVARGSRQAPLFTGFGIRPYQALEGRVALKLTVRRR